MTGPVTDLFKLCIHTITTKPWTIEEAAKNLYAALHRLDKSKLDIILIELLPNEGVGKSVNDRLVRAVN